MDGAGDAYVSGFTYSLDFPALNGPDLTYNGGGDAFVTTTRPGAGARRRLMSLELLRLGTLGSSPPGNPVLAHTRSTSVAPTI